MESSELLACASPGICKVQNSVTIDAPRPTAAQRARLFTGHRVAQVTHRPGEVFLRNECRDPGQRLLRRGIIKVPRHHVHMEVRDQIAKQLIVDNDRPVKSAQNGHPTPCLRCSQSSGQVRVMRRFLLCTHPKLIRTEPIPPRRRLAS